MLDSVIGNAATLAAQFVRHLNSLPFFRFLRRISLMATIAAQAYLIASFNWMLASRRENERLSPPQIVELLCRMAEAEDFRSLQEYNRFFSARSGEYSLHRL